MKTAAVIKLQNDLGVTKTPNLLWSPELQRAFVERIGESGIIIVNESGQILFISQRACHVLGESESNVLSKNYFDDLKFTDESGIALSKTKMPVWQALHTKDYLQITPFFISFQNSAQQVKSLVIKVTQVAEASRTLAIIEIREVKRNLHLNEMKTLFISFAAHQLKTPSSIVKGFIELLLREGKKAFSAVQWSHLESAYEANENLIRLSKNLLNVTKLEGGLIEPSISHFDALELVRGKISSHNLLLSIKNITVNIDSPDRISFESDPLFFSEVFEILLSNAIKYSPENSEILVTIFATKDDLRVTVNDNGPGVPIEQEQQLFSAFNASHTHTNSHGMGLLMAKKYLDLLGAQIGYERRTEGGSRFYFSIPKPIR
jgi:two-component system sensor histidine kinase KdpD